MYSNWQHILPLNDIKPHIEDGFNCDCEPKIDWENEIVTHNSFDHREIIEEVNELLTNSNNLN